jgi:hypothetical protein
MTANRAPVSNNDPEPERLAGELAELKDALRQLELLRAAAASFEQDLDRAFRWPTNKPITPNQKPKFDKHGLPTKYNRAPQRWKGRHGYEFVCGIMKIRARDNCNVAAAIRKLKESDQQKWPEPERALQRRYQELKGYWGPWCAVGMRLTAAIEELLVHSGEST